jgi:SecD/SecF fusion protein
LLKEEDQFWTSPKDTATVNGYFKRADIKILLTAEQRYAKFVWGKPTIIKDAKDKDVDAVELYALKGNRDNVAAMSGGVVTDASFI